MEIEPQYENLRNTERKELSRTSFRLPVAILVAKLSPLTIELHHK